MPDVVALPLSSAKNKIAISSPNPKRFENRHVTGRNQHRNKERG
jgi:hypothetical protein